MTWQEFKDTVESAGMKDEDEVWFINWHTMGDEVHICINDDGAKSIYS